jgi:hypothetical protein
MEWREIVQGDSIDSRISAVPWLVSLPAAYFARLHARLRLASAQREYRLEFQIGIRAFTNPQRGCAFYE